mmetsp:Transcript_618/g.972  ORF Transcript_618/g.972 Transcript_618/m.972 type:complete len:227 (-) Transcript_618:55-735(-)|eukprot:CAMPEP_0194232810 /NCGR_PEP_ID=MMETSP0158-20130606/1035_1 /TAXON_ID=33649 /ORGANISM="Thalassionema nitzschioides, Strain L26-B" /LENGTH=226 /DNA_ID=CAMNT_0038965623 /DNA_START=106 /DNA_END=786 /DNA_ORIENTATION=-
MPATWVVWTTVSVLVPSVLIHLQKDRLNIYLMGVFRDIARSKAHKRRYGENSMALMEVLLRKEEEVMIDAKLLEEEDASDVPTYTLGELWDYGNGADDSPLLISVFGRIYDVSAGEKYYGPEGAYPLFAGHDITYALSTGCKTCVKETAENLEEKQLLEGKRWLSFFQLHDKYPYVGKLEENPITEELMNQWIDEAISKKGEGDMLEETFSPPISNSNANTQSETT